MATIMLTCMIDAFKRRDVTTINIPEIFLQTKRLIGGESMHVILDGRMAEFLAKLSPATYQEYVHQRHRQAYIYCRVNIAICGTLKASLLFWKKMSSSLKQQGYIINPYDWCVTNKDIAGK